MRALRRDAPAAENGGLPTTTAAQIGVTSIEWGKLPKRFLNEGELEVLVALVRSVDARVMIEVGCNEGRTAKAMLMNVPTLRRYVGIDVPVGHVPSLAIQRREVPAQPGYLAAGERRFEMMLRPMGSLNLIAHDLPKCDAMFIDGDHGRRAVTHDSALAHSVVRPGGIIVWHDYNGEGRVDVKPVLEELAATGRHIVHVTGTWMAFERIPL